MDKILTFSIAAYNVEDTIEETLSSLICDQRTMERIEALIVDDGSTDGTFDKVHPFLEKYPDTYTYVKKENGGHGSTLTYSIHHAKGKYMRMLDGDDVVSSGVLDDYVRFLESSDADIVVSPFVEYYANGKEDLMDRHSLEHGKLYEITEANEVQSHEVAYKTSLLKGKDIHLEEHCVYTDVEYCFYATLYSNTIQKYDKVIYRYRKGVEGQTVSDAGRRKRPEDFKRVLFKIISEYKKEENNPDVLRKQRLFHQLCDPLFGNQVENILKICNYTPSEKRKRYVELYEELEEIGGGYLDYRVNESPSYKFRYELYTLPLYSRYIIWGCGNYGKIAVPLIQELYGSNILITDANPSKWGEDFFGETIISPEKVLSKREEDSVFVVAMKDGTEVKNQLIDWGVEADKIYCL